jgi:hypothetical protein
MVTFFNYIKTPLPFIANYLYHIEHIPNTEQKSQPD